MVLPGADGVICDAIAIVNAIPRFACLTRLCTWAQFGASVPYMAGDTLVIRRVAPGEPTETVLGSVATDPAPRATLLYAVDITCAPVPKAEPLNAPTEDPAPTAVALPAPAVARLPNAAPLAEFAVAPLPNAEELCAVGTPAPVNALAPSPTAVPPLLADVAAPIATDPVATAPLPIAVALTPVARALRPTAMAAACVA